MEQVSRSSPCAKRTGSCSGVSVSAEGVERFGKIIDSKIIFGACSGVSVSAESLIESLMTE